MARGPALALSLALTLVAACKPPAVPSPLVGQSRHLCCNLFYEKPSINDVNYQRGTMIPFGTPVEIQSVSGRTVHFQATGHPPIELQLRYGRKVLTMEQFLDRLFVVEDPHARLRKVRVDKTRGKKTADRATAAQRAEVQRINEAIERAQVVPGMTRDEVLMAIGYPPAHRSAITSNDWTYWENRVAEFYVRFDGDKVGQVQR